MSESRLKLADVRTVWERMKPGVDKICGRLNLDWKPEDLYAFCLFREAFVHICDDGFAVVRIRQNQFNLKNELFVWLIIGWSGEDLVNEYMDDMMAIAKDAGCCDVVFDSPRLAWHKVAKENNWSMMASYRIPVA